MPSELWNVPNCLSLSRLPLAAGLFACIATDAWLLGLIIFSIAAFTDWLDGWWARRFKQFTAIGRSLDPLTDKVLIGGAFIYLISVKESLVLPWMTTVIISRELLVTGLRGMVEATGVKFAADWFGKLKTFLQCVVLIGVLLLQTLRTNGWFVEVLTPLEWAYVILLYAMLIATVGSGVQYVVKAARIFSK